MQFNSTAVLSSLVAITANCWCHLRPYVSNIAPPPDTKQYQPEVAALHSCTRANHNCCDLTSPICFAKSETLLPWARAAITASEGQHHCSPAAHDSSGRPIQRHLVHEPYYGQGLGVSRKSDSCRDRAAAEKQCKQYITHPSWGTPISTAHCSIADSIPVSATKRDSLAGKGTVGRTTGPDNLRRQKC